MSPRKRPPTKAQKAEQIRQARIQSALVLVSQKIFILREIQRLLSLASSDKIPCHWVDPTFDAAASERADVYLQLPLTDLRKILCGHSHPSDEVTT